MSGPYRLSDFNYAAGDRFVNPVTLAVYTIVEEGGQLFAFVDSPPPCTVRFGREPQLMRELLFQLPTTSTAAVKLPCGKEFDPTKNRTPLGLLSGEERAVLERQAGKLLYWSSTRDVWEPVTLPQTQLDKNRVLRVTPGKGATFTHAHYRFDEAGYLRTGGRPGPADVTVFLLWDGAGQLVHRYILPRGE